MELDEQPETADVETSSDDYALRFSGAVGAWFLKLQEEVTLRLLAPYPGASVLDVGGGHGQITKCLVQSGYRLTVLGSSNVCDRRIQTFVDINRCSFKVGNILALPFPDRKFDIVISYRLLPHVMQWKKFLSELSRVAEQAVLIDYPSKRSVNCLIPVLFRLKKRLEGNTRRFTAFRESELLSAFGSFGFKGAGRYPEFFFPMVLHRTIKSPRLSLALEAMLRSSGATSIFGSPVILKVVRG